MAMPAATETAVGVDVGGTWLRAARVGRTGAILDQVTEPVERGREAFATQLARLVAAIGGGSRGVGIGIPGRVADGRILSAGHLDIAGLDLTATVGAATGLPVHVENDTAMALLAEAQGLPGLVLMLTVGTGIGGAAAVGGALWRGGGLAGQFGHLVVAEDGPPCRCGGRGCVETFSSGTALGALIVQAGLPPESRVETLLQGGHEDLLRRWAGPFRRALDSLAAAFGPTRIVIGGGLGAPMLQALALLPDPGPWYPLPLASARLGPDAGVSGAGLAGFAASE